MKKKEKLVILILLIMVVVLIIAKSKQKEENSAKNETVETVSDSSSSENESISNETTTATDEPNVVLLEDGTKMNASSKLLETKIIDGIELTDIQLTENNNVTYLLGTLTNNTSKTQGGYKVDVIFYDENGNEITTVGGVIIELEPGESTQFNTNGTFEVVNAYDFKIVKSN